MAKELKGRQITVGIGAVIEDERVLFVRRHSPTIPEYDEKWELPGGKIEIGEAPEAAIEREVFEETGLRVTCSSILPFTFSRAIRTETEEVHVIVLCARCELARESNGVPDGDQECRWIGVEDIDFNRVIPGSKEFLLWALRGSKAKVPQHANLYEMQLESVDEAQNKRRGYHVVLIFTPDSDLQFVVECRYGRIGQHFRAKKVGFRRMDQALEYAQAVVTRRKQHGYELTAIDENHPLRSWIRDKNVPSGRSFEPQQGKLFDK